ncbi:MAG: SAM-dependent methyltransferase, partial [Bacteroidia bacterium]|nr:SAM-dependent methyltransferase [Bacteroidia bacterium]
TTTSVTWNHSLSEVINSLINSRLRIDSFNEFDYSPYNCLNNMVEVSENRFMIKGMEKKLPLVYAIRALKQ